MMYNFAYNHLPYDILNNFSQITTHFIYFLLTMQKNYNIINMNHDIFYKQFKKGGLFYVDK